MSFRSPPCRWIFFHLHDTRQDDVCVVSVMTWPHLCEWLIPWFIGINPCTGFRYGCLFSRKNNDIFCFISFFLLCGDIRGGKEETRHSSHVVSIKRVHQKSLNQWIFDRQVHWNNITCGSVEASLLQSLGLICPREGERKKFNYCRCFSSKLKTIPKAGM